VKEVTNFYSVPKIGGWTGKPFKEITMQQLETDLVICGGGFAGLSAVITAREGGADVILLEKKNVLGGTSAFGFGAGRIAGEQVLENVGK
jgi:succinate dehydrogenase/fumarate reductase flavoprotein subunit